MAKKHKGAKKASRYKSLVIPCLTVFIASFCIMVVELVAGRLVARFLGSSLYTWTAVIGVVLAGITLGNYIGGRMADRFQARKALAWLFAISSVTCVLIIILNNLVGGWIWLLKLSWPMRIFTHVAVVFLLPSALLGTISPVVAKMALDRGLPTGRTVGSIYAWGAAGSIAGTFAAGYYLIAQMGSIAIIWAVAAALMLMAIFYYARRWLLYTWLVVFPCVLVMGLAPWEWASQTGAALALRKAPDKSIIYEDETAYCYVFVRQLSSEPDRRAFYQDKLQHSEIIMDDVLDLQYFYHHIYAAITGGLSADKDNLTVLVMGGGGYVFSRYIEKVWPGSQVDVVEIDPGVTEAAIQAFGLERDTSIRTFTMDARNYVDALLEQERKSSLKTRYDFIYGDALSDYSIPYQLTTREFNDKIAKMLTNDGVYMVNVIDIFDSGLFLGAIINTLEKTFPYVYAATRGDLPRAARTTFAVVAAKRGLDIDNLWDKYSRKSQNFWHLSESDMQVLREKSRGLVLTDDYAPVETLLAPVIPEDTIDLLCVEYVKEAQELLQQGKFGACVSKYREIIRIDPTLSVRMYNEIGGVLLRQGKWAEAIEAFENCLKYISDEKLIINTGTVHYNLAGALKRAGKIKQANQQFRMAAEEYRKELLGNPRSVRTHLLLAKSLAAIGSFDEAEKHFLQAVNLNPLDVNAHLGLVRSLERQGKFDEAIERLRAAVVFMLNRGQKEAAAKLQEYLQALQSKQSQKKD